MNSMLKMRMKEVREVTVGSERKSEQSQKGEDGLRNTPARSQHCERNSLGKTMS